MSDTGRLHFVVFVLASLAAFVVLLHVVLRHRTVRPGLASVVWVSVVVVPVGMVFAKIAYSWGLPPLIYYGVPASTTVLLPPVVFRMRRRELIAYLCASSALPFAIHLAFSLGLGWKEYLPFWTVPSIRELLS